MRLSTLGRPPPGPRPHEARPSSYTLRQVADDLRWELRRHGPLPPGPTRFSLRTTHRLLTDPLPMLPLWYERYGPMFTVRGMHRLEVVMLGPQANHYALVENAANFSWRQGHFGELTALLGDGLITTDGERHDRARRIMMPAFHHRQMDAYVEVMVQETRRALEAWRPGRVVDVYGWIRELALRIAMRTLLGLDPDDRGSGHEAAVQFGRALAFYGTDYWTRMLRGPGTPWSRMRAATRALDAIVYAEIARRRRQGSGQDDDVLALLLAAGELSDRELRDHIVTLLFGGHDTTSSTLSFLLYELARHPEERGRVLDEQDRVLRGERPTAEALLGALPQLDMALDETLRLYPPVWVSPRRALDAFEFAGHRVPAGAFVMLSSFASHRLSDVFAQADRFVPARFAPDARTAMPRGAYIPFGGGSRICIGKRFGQLVVKAVATTLLQRLTVEQVPGHRLRWHFMPTLSPKGELPMVVGDRALRGSRAA